MATNWSLSYHTSNICSPQPRCQHLLDFRGHQTTQSPFPNFHLLARFYMTAVPQKKSAKMVDILHDLRHLTDRLTSFDDSIRRGELMSLNSVRHSMEKCEISTICSQLAALPCSSSSNVTFSALATRISGN